MDDLFRVPVLGWRFGLDALIGLVPGLGDTTTALVSFYILAAAVRYSVPKITLLRMGLNIGIDYVVGSLPIVGDFATRGGSRTEKCGVAERARDSFAGRSTGRKRATGFLSEA